MKNRESLKRYLDEWAGCEESEFYTEKLRDLIYHGILEDEESGLLPRLCTEYNMQVQFC